MHRSEIYTKNLLVKLKKKVHSVNVFVDGKMISKEIVKVWTGLIYIRIGPSHGFLWTRYWLLENVSIHDHLFCVTLCFALVLLL